MTVELVLVSSPIALKVCMYVYIYVLIICIYIYLFIYLSWHRFSTQPIWGSRLGQRR